MDKIEVTQADRDALEGLDDALGFLMDDERAIVLDALAKHRLAASAELVSVAEPRTIYVQWADNGNIRKWAWSEFDLAEKLKVETRPVSDMPTAFRFVHLDHMGRKVSRYGVQAERVNGHDPIEKHPLYTHPPATDVAALVDHFRRMIEACANYVEPTTYIARHPTGELCKWNTEFPEPDKHQSIDGALATTRRRDQAFISDIIYMLDGPEQRAALAPFTKGQP